MLERKESPGKVPATENRKHATNWIPLDIAPLIAQRMYSRQPLPGERLEKNYADSPLAPYVPDA